MHGARLPKLHAIPRSHTFFGNLFPFLFFWCTIGFLFQTHHATIIRISAIPRHSMETLNPEGASSRSRSPSRSPEAAPQHPSTPPIRVTESEELVLTPDMVPHVDSSCAGCLAPSRRLKHTCTKAKHTGKRHALQHQTTNPPNKPFKTKQQPYNNHTTI